MIHAIQRFVSALRKAGLAISPAEVIDAARALQAVGVEQRERFRAALRAALVKRRADVEPFERTFRSFFASGRPATSRGRGARMEGRGGGTRTGRDEGAPAAPGWPRAEARQRARPGRLKMILQRRPDPASRAREPRRAPARDGRGASPRPPGRRPAPAPRAAVPADARRLELAQPLSRDEEASLAAEVPRLVQQIRLRAGRRVRRGVRGRLWTARLMRHNVGTGGVPFVLPYRRRRPRRPRVMVLADVSWSVMRASALFLMMAEAFLRAGRRASVYLFVDRCVEATDALRRWDRADPSSFARFLETLPGLDPAAPSDYGRAFYQAAHSRHAALKASRGDTILVVLGDARGNMRDPQAWAFEDLASRCRRVIWLDPEPAPLWDTGDSVLSAYLPSCDLVCEARDLEGIARGLSEIARGL